MTHTARFMASSLLNHADDLAEGIHKIKCKYGYDDKDVKHVELNAKVKSALLNTKMEKKMFFII